MPIEIRPSRASDVAAMAAIRARGSHNYDFWADRIARYLRGEHAPQQALAERAAFVALDGDALVGFVAGHRTRRNGCDGELQWIDVIEECRGQGIAGRLLQPIFAWFVEQRAFRICVNVAPENLPAVRLYAGHGAVPLNAHWMVWEDARQMRRKDPPST
jgi:GNAT superfamily N-acetyltransferase